MALRFCFLLLTIFASAAAYAPQPLLVHARTAKADAPGFLSRSGPIVAMGRKGRPKMPAGGMQGGYASGAQQRTNSPPADGSTVFYLYCRSSPGKPWYPVSAMKGDGQSKGLINAWLGSPFAKQVFKDRLDEGMAKSIFDSERRLAEMAVAQYTQLKDYKSRLQWGFKILDKDVMAKEAAGEIEEVKIVPVSKSMISEGGVLQQAQNAASNLFSGGANK